MNPVKFFIVDDDKVFVFLAKKIIKSVSTDVDFKSFEDGMAIFEYLKEIISKPELLPDIIFLDLNMPVMDGWEFLKEYVLLHEKIEKKIPVYLVSSSISPHDIERAKNISVVSDFIIKPLRREKIVELFDILTLN